MLEVRDADWHALKESYASSLAPFEALHREAPEERRARANVALNYKNYGAILQKLGDDEAALPYVEKALDLDRRWLAEEPESASASMACRLLWTWPSAAAGAMIPPPGWPGEIPKESRMRIGVLRGRENSFPDALIAKINSMGRGVTAEYVQLGGTKLNEPVPYRVVIDRMSHEVPYYAVYLKMAALQGTYCINNVFWRSADDKFFGYAAAEKLGIAEPRTVVLPNREYVPDVNSESLRNLWPTDFSMYLDYVGLPCIMKPAFGGGWKEVYKITSLEELLTRYNASGQNTVMLQQFIEWDTYIRVPTIGKRWARAIGYDPKPLAMGGYNQDYEVLPRALRDTAEELSLRFNQALGYDMNALEFAVKDGLFYGIDLTNYTPDLDYRSLKDAHFPWAVEKMAEFAVEKALSGEPTPAVPDWRALVLR